MIEKGYARFDSLAGCRSVLVPQVVMLERVDPPDHFAMKRGVWLWLKKYHMRHHYQDDHVGYGVSSPLWCVASSFGSAPPLETVGGAFFAPVR